MQYKLILLNAYYNLTNILNKRVRKPQGLWILNITISEFALFIC